MRAIDYAVISRKAPPSLAVATTPRPATGTPSPPGTCPPLPKVWFRPKEMYLARSICLDTLPFKHELQGNSGDAARKLSVFMDIECFLTQSA
jgi:hypothetical protein